MKNYEKYCDYRLAQAITKVTETMEDRSITCFSFAIMRNGCRTADDFIRKYEDYLIVVNKRGKMAGKAKWKKIGPANMDKLDEMYTILTGLKPNEEKKERRKVQSFKRIYIPLKRGA